MGLSVIDLFCGCGGFSLGANLAGFNVDLAIDIDKILTSSHARNFGEGELLLANIAGISGSEIVKKLGGRPTGIIGGPPCQAFSAIGRRISNDPRRDLVFDFFRLVSEIKPIFFVMENVKGLGYADARPVLDAALEIIPSYYALLDPMTLDAADFGAATKRERLFVIGYNPDYCDHILPQSFDSKKESASTVHDAISDLVAAKPLGIFDGFDTWRITKPGRPGKYASSLRSPNSDFTGHTQTHHTKEVRQRFRRLKPGEIDVVGRHPKLSWTGLCPTLRAGTGNDKGSYQSVRPLHPDEPRVITVREAARLQGFPDFFRFHPTIWHSFRMIGNSVSPIIAQAILSLIGSKIGNRALAAAE